MVDVEKQFTLMGCTCNIWGRNESIRISFKHQDDNLKVCGNDMLSRPTVFISMSISRAHNIYDLLVFLVAAVFLGINVVCTQ